MWGVLSGWLQHSSVRSSWQLCVSSVRPPKKSWKKIYNLSGGEKTLSSLALVFALHHFKPTPLYFMDEIDAALDFKNVSIVACYIYVSTLWLGLLTLAWCDQAFFSVVNTQLLLSIRCLMGCSRWQGTDGLPFIIQYSIKYTVLVEICQSV